MAERGGARPGAGRKPKADEVALIERLSPLDGTAFALIETGLNNQDMSVLKLFMEYRFGKPKQSIDANVVGSMDIIWNEVKTYDNE
jgi:hypothetical protein